MEGMNFSLESLDNLIEELKAKKKEEEEIEIEIEISEEKELTNEEKMQKITEIIEGVSRKYFSYGKQGAKYLSQEDATQELWVRILELIQDCGGVKNTDLPLVARIAYNKAVDLFRFHQRRYDSKVQFIEGSDQEYDELNRGTETYFDLLHSEKFMRGYDLVLYKEVIDLFKIGSKERNYVVLKLVNSGLLSKSDLDPWDQAIVAIPEREDEVSYAHLIGYTGATMSGSWCWKKEKMHMTIVNFLK